jgi:hypothetical protein
VRESTAFRHQARSDLEAAKTLGGAACAPALRAHVIAKSQQGVEKIVKAAVIILTHAGIQIPGVAGHPATNATVPKGHKVGPYATAITLLTAGQRQRAHPPAILALSKVFDADLHIIAQLDALAPAWPVPPVALHARNTEYPFERTANDWTPPSDGSSVFTAQETRWLLDAATRILDGVDRIVQSLESMYP